MLSSDVPGENLDMPFTRMLPESIYVHKAGELLESITDAPREECVNRDFCLYWIPHEQL